MGPTAALWIYVGREENNYLGGCNFEFAFTTGWGSSSSCRGWGGGEWGERESDIIPQDISLGHNYPNPFNAETTVPFELTEADNVKLGIYNIKGQLVETLFDDYKEVGYHVVNFDASMLSSGVYFYKLTTGDRSYTKRMVLLK
ncbi:MAG: T9SS type A sorting domain-containing protein [candidate division Zixibacteria bacterium]|nr:T9SS type A sorting domain-containing protein [candidate division Zixibacteria bacterium]